MSYEIFGVNSNIEISDRNFFYNIETWFSTFDFFSPQTCLSFLLFRFFAGVGVIASSKFTILTGSSSSSSNEANPRPLTEEQLNFFLPLSRRKTPISSWPYWTPTRSLSSALLQSALSLALSRSHRCAGTDLKLRKMPSSSSVHALYIESSGVTIHFSWTKVVVRLESVQLNARASRVRFTFVVDLKKRQQSLIF